MKIDVTGKCFLYENRHFFVKYIYFCGDNQINNQNMTTMKKILFLATMFAFCSVNLFAQSSGDDYDRELDKLLVVMNADETFDDVMAQQLAPLISNGTVKKEKLEGFMAEVKELLMPRLIEETRKFYKANFSFDELKQINDFFSSEVGKKHLQLSPQSMDFIIEMFTDDAVLEKMTSLFSKYFQ